MDATARRKILLFLGILILISIACTTLTGIPESGLLDEDVPLPPPPPEGYIEEESQLLPDSSQTQFQPVMTEILAETAHTLGYPTPNIIEPTVGLDAMTQPCYHDDGCITQSMGEFLYADGTVGPSFYKYTYNLPLSEVEVPCDQKFEIQVNYLSNTYLATLEHQNFWNEHPSYSIDTDYYSFPVQQLFYESDWEIGIGYAWVYGDIMVDFWMTGTKMADNCWGPGMEPSPDALYYFYEIMRSRGLAD